MEIIALASQSFVNYCQLVFRGQLHLEHGRLGKSYRASDGGSYSVFRDTISQRAWPNPPVVLVVGFRLKLIGSSRLLHWLFQRLCILTTPFWSGFAGFHIKLWLVDHKTKNYLGIYSWSGREEATVYVTALERVLRAVSTKGSVWHEIIDNQGFADYLAKQIA